MPTEIPIKMQSDHKFWADPPCVVTVLVPVYKGFEETRDCINSVLKTSVSCKTRIELVVINDESPDPILSDWLESHAQEHSYKLIVNSRNLGFVGTVNLGMAQTKNDVVLLNSDAEVANDWLDRLVNACYRSKVKVSSVTPFSNNATICSFPNICQDNELPINLALEQVDSIFALANTNKSIEIPTAVGFCMYITRRSLDEVGLFDEEKFGKGYGEENEFCLRAKAAGWTHLHALDTFVWHKGSVSFGTDVQAERVKHAMRIIEDEYPSYQLDVQRFISFDPARISRLVTTYMMFQVQYAKRALMVTHDRYGGVQRNIDDLVLAYPEVGWILVKPSSSGRVSLELSQAETNSRLEFLLPNDFSLLKRFLMSIGVSFIHWHHLLGLPFEIRNLLKELRVPNYFTVHDYYMACPHISMTKDDGFYCGEPSLVECEKCVSSRPVLGIESVKEWREKSDSFLSQMSTVFAPSIDCKTRINKYFPSVAIDVVYHPELNGDAPEANEKSTGNAHSKLKVGIIGGLSKIKGADILDEVAIKAKKKGSNIEFCLFGHAYRRLHDSIEVTGPYLEEDLTQMVTNWGADILWYPAIWPETYSYTLSAGLHLNLPIVATDIGAFEERLRDRDATWLVNFAAKPDEWLSWFETVNVQELKKSRVKKGVGPDSKKLTKDFYDNLYLNVAFQPGDQELLRKTMSDFSASVFVTPKQGLREKLVQFLYRLRSYPFFSPIVKRIPMNVQIKVKNLVMGYKR